jgi:hypothetical protein
MGLSRARGVESDNVLTPFDPFAPGQFRVALAALLFEPDMEVFPGRKARQRHHEVASGVTDQPLDASLVVPFPGRP